MELWEALWPVEEEVEVDVEAAEAQTAGGHVLGGAAGRNVGELKEKCFVGSALIKLTEKAVLMPNWLFPLLVQLETAVFV